MVSSGNAQNIPTGIRKSSDSKGVMEIHRNKMMGSGNPHNKVTKSSNPQMKK